MPQSGPLWGTTATAGLIDPIAGTDQHITFAQLTLAGRK